MIAIVPLPYSFTVVADPAAISAARRRVGAVARTWGLLHADAVADLELCTAELVGHAYTDTHAPCGVRLRWTGRRVRLEVTDIAEELPGNPDPGTGLFVVAHIAVAWGSQRHPGGRLLWCEVGPETLVTDRRLAARLRATVPLRLRASSETTRKEGIMPVDAKHQGPPAPIRPQQPTPNPPPTEPHPDGSTPPGPGRHR